MRAAMSHTVLFIVSSRMSTESDRGIQEIDAHERRDTVPRSGLTGPAATPTGHRLPQAAHAMPEQGGPQPPARRCKSLCINSLATWRLASMYLQGQNEPR